MKYFQRIVLFMAAAVIGTACNEPYDPIGPNKPSPVLLVNPLELAYDSEGGALKSSISTNAELIEVGELPDWIESAVVSEDLSSIEVKVKQNSDSDKVKRGFIKLLCSSGENTATQYIKVFQAGKDQKIAFAAFTGKSLPSGWTADDPNRLSIGNGFLSFKSDEAPGYLYKCNQQFTPTGKKYYCSVDMKMNGGEGGLKLYVNDDPKQDVKIYFSFNSSTGRGGIWVQNGPNWCAMDDGTIGSGDCPNKYNNVYTIPEPTERDDWWRVAVYTTETAPNEPVIEIISLKTFNGEQKELQAHYSRKFTFADAGLGCVGLWSRAGDCQFKNFVLSYQN